MHVAELADLRGAEWRAEAKGRIGALMARLRLRWDDMSQNDRQLVTGAAYALWRAAFRMFDDEDGRPVEDVEAHALSLLETVVGSAATSIDDAKWRKWSGGYYINDAAYRVSELINGPGAAHSHDATRPLSDAWNDIFAALEQYVDHASDPHGADTIRLDRPKRR